MARLTHGQRAEQVTLALGAVGAGVVILFREWAGLWTLVPLSLHIGVIVLAAVVLGRFAGRVRGHALAEMPAQELDPARIRELARRQARTVFRMAAELNATLNYERVLDMALDLSAQVLSEADSPDDRLVSALLLFEEGRLRVASARRLTHADRRILFPGESGVFGQALATFEAQHCEEPAHDPELRRVAAIQNCNVALCIPLTAGLDAYGVLLFAHTRPGYFDSERVELLEAVGQQVMIALQNARLYRDLEQEKERITEIQEEARKKLARDLHDGPTQSIAAIAMRANFVRRLMERDAKAASVELYKVEDLARRTTKEIRHMLFTMRPLILESRGLVAALGQLADKVRETHGQQVLIDAQPDVAQDLEMGKQGVVFYIAEEAINNARKHAEAEHVWVRLRREGDLFVLEVQDDGVGFNVGAVDANYEQLGSLGMVNMRERTELVNGILRIQSSEGDGTRITVVVPLSEESAERLHTPGFVV
jgi:signal transduction histidine kinase